MKQRTLISMALIIGLTGCATRSPSGWRTCAGLAAAAPAASRVAAPCVRRLAAFYDLPAELARVERNCPGVMACPQGLRNIEVKDIAQPGNHLWSGSTNQSFIPLDQDGFIAAAHVLAQAARPPSKELISIEYLYYYALCLGPPLALLGARATYAECGVVDIAD